VTSLFHHVKLEKIAPAEWKKIVVVYDNICNLDRTIAARNPLPLPQPFDRLWMDPLKVLDVFHLSNHVADCRKKYNPRDIKELHPNLEKRNTQAAEQTNSWFRHFIAILNAIPRDRQLFYIHCLVKARNDYLYERSPAEMEEDEVFLDGVSESDWEEVEE
jgi:hypothetical protein